MSAASNSSESTSAAAGAAEGERAHVRGLEGASRDSRKWPAYKTLGVLAVVNAVLWGGLYLLAKALGFF